jgi:hypothetical protein
VIPNASQQLFNAFGSSSSPATQSVTKQDSGSASQQLFDAFSTPSAPSSLKNVKDSILSLYGAQPHKKVAQQQPQAGLNDFAKFQASSALPKDSAKPFDQFESAQEPIHGDFSGNKSSNNFDMFGSINQASDKPFSIPQPTSPAKPNLFDPPHSLGFATAPTPTASPSKELFDAFASITPGNSFSPGAGTLSTQTKATGFSSSIIGNSQWNSGNSISAPTDDFGDFTQFSVSEKQTPSNNQPKPLAVVASPAQDGWAGWGDQVKGSSFQSTEGLANQKSTVTASPMHTLPASSRNASNIIDQLDISPKKPMSFDTLPPVDDGWGGFQ